MQVANEGNKKWCPICGTTPQTEAKMRTQDFPNLMVRNGFALMGKPALAESLVPVAARAAALRPCDRAGRIQLLREAYMAMLREEPTPGA